CDYGLNTDTPTSPSRTRPIELAIRDLQHIAERGRVVYFAVDAIAPAYLKRLTGELVARGIDLRWAAGLRLEPLLARGLAEELRRGGCVALSFGYESGSQRVLDRIDKGVKLEKVAEILEAVSEVGIGAQMMGFVGFPGETAEEAEATYQFLLDHRAH